MITIFKIIAQLTYLILITYFQHGHHIKADKISTRKECPRCKPDIFVSKGLIGQHESYCVDQSGA